MHNIRKIKNKKKKKTISTNPEELAQQKLFEISHHEQEQFKQFYADDFHHNPFNFKTQKQKQLSQLERTLPPKKNSLMNHIQDNIKDIRKLTQEKSESSEEKSLKNLSNEKLLRHHLYSTEFKRKEPINLIRFMIVDNRDDKKEQRHKFSHSQFQDFKSYSVSSIRKKMLNNKHLFNKTYHVVSTTEVQKVKVELQQNQNLEMKDFLKEKLDSKDVERKEEKLKSLKSIPFKKLMVGNFNKISFYSPIEIKNIKLVSKFSSKIT